MGADTQKCVNSNVHFGPIIFSGLLFFFIMSFRASRTNCWSDIRLDVRRFVNAAQLASDRRVCIYFSFGACFAEAFFFVATDHSKKRIPEHLTPKHP